MLPQKLSEYYILILIHCCLIIPSVFGKAVWSKLSHIQDPKSYFFMPTVNQDCQPWDKDCFQQTSGELTECLLDDPENDECSAYSGPIEWCSLYHEVCSCKVFIDLKGKERSACLTRRQDFQASSVQNYPQRTLHAYCSNSWVCGIPEKRNIQKKSLYEVTNRVDIAQYPESLTKEEFAKLDKLFNSIPLGSVGLRQVLTHELSKVNRRSLVEKVDEQPEKARILPFNNIATTHGDGSFVPLAYEKDSKNVSYSYIATSGDIQTCSNGDHSFCSSSHLPKEWCMLPLNMQWHNGGCGCETIPNGGNHGLNSNEACVQQRRDLVGNIHWTFCSKHGSSDYCKTRYLLNQKKSALPVRVSPVIPGLPEFTFVNSSGNSYECFNNDHCADLIPPKEWCSKPMKTGCSCGYLHEGPGRNNIDNKSCIVIGVDNSFTYCTQNLPHNRCHKGPTIGYY